MAKQKYIKPEIKSSNAFSLTSQACDVNQTTFCTQTMVIWEVPPCSYVFKSPVEGECTPPGTLIQSS